jgi:hypothetical protein
MGAHSRRTHLHVPALTTAAAGSLAVTAALLVPGGAQSAGTGPATLTAYTHPLSASHRHHLIHQARENRGVTSTASRFQGTTATTATVTTGGSSFGTYSSAGLEQLWIAAGGPASAAAHAASIATCESGGQVTAHNPSGATGLWQILGSVVPGNLDNPQVNAANAVAKFRASGDTFAQWVCK